MTTSTKSTRLGLNGSLRRIAAAMRHSDWERAARELAAAEAMAPIGLDRARLHVAAAELHNLTVDRPAARASGEAALAILASHPAEAGLIARASAELGTALWFLLRDPAAAEPHYRRASEYVAKDPAIPTGRRLQILNDFALCLQNTDHATEAAALYSEVGAAAKAAGLHLLARRARRRSGTLLIDRALFEAAEKELRTARPPSRAGADERFEWHHAMALLAEKNERFLVAERHYDAAVAAFEENRGANADKVGALVNAAILKLMLGWPEVASHLLDLAQVAASAHPPAGFAFAYPAARAALQAERGDLAGGVALMEQAAATAVDAFPDQHGYHLAFHIYGAELLIAGGRTAEAAKLLRRALVAINPDMELLPPEAFIAEFILAETELMSGAPAADVRSMLRHAGKLFLAGVGEEGTWRALAAFADFAANGGDLRRAVAFGKLAVMRGSKWALHGGMRSLEQPGGPMRLYRVLERLTGRLASDHRLVEARASRALIRNLTAFSGPRARPWMLELTDAELAIEADVEAVLTELRAKPDLMQGGTAPSTFDRLLALDRGQASLPRQAFVGAANRAPPARTAVLRYYLEGQSPLVEIETAADRAWVELPVAKAGLTTLATWLVDQMLAEGDWQQQSQKLYEALLRPALPYLGEVDELQIVTGPQLGELPFAALSDGTSFLVQRYALAFRSGAGGRQRQPRPPRIATFGSQVAEQGAERLPLVPEELASIRSAFSGVTSRLGRRFTSDALRRALSAGSSVVHIAGHFHLVPGSARRSRLYLGSGAPLSVAEFTSDAFDWSVVDLLFLSGCESGTDDRLMDDNRTLASTLHESGVQALVASQWLVEDRTSIELVDGFYRALKAGLSPTRALADAQRGLMAPSASPVSPAVGVGAGSPKYRPARHWAGYRVIVPGT